MSDAELLKSLDEHRRLGRTARGVGTLLAQHALEERARLALLEPRLRRLLGLRTRLCQLHPKRLELRLCLRRLCRRRALGLPRTRRVVTRGRELLTARRQVRRARLLHPRHRLT